MRKGLTMHEWNDFADLVVKANNLQLTIMIKTTEDHIKQRINRGIMELKIR